MNHNVSSRSLVKVTAELLRNRPSTLTMKQLATDLAVSVEWLSLLANDKIPNASADKVQRVYERLTGELLLPL